MHSTGISCTTFCNRAFRCYYFKEEFNYIKMAKLLFNSILKTLSPDTASDMMRIFTEKYNKKKYTGRSVILKEHRATYRDFCLTCAINIKNLLKNYEVIKIFDKYNYKFLINGHVDAVIKRNGKYYNVHFSYNNSYETKKSIDIAVFNSYIYNITNNYNNNLLIMSVPENIFYKIDYNEKDYTIRRGYITSTSKTKIRKQGVYCSNCSQDCKAEIITDSNRLDLLL